jgi:hypothetical protein
MKKGFLAPATKNRKKKKTTSTNIVENAINIIMQQPPSSNGGTNGNRNDDALLLKKQKQAWVFLLQRTEDEIEARELIHKDILALLLKQLDTDDDSSLLISLQIFNSLTKHTSIIHKINFVPFIAKAKSILDLEGMRVLKTNDLEEENETKGENVEDTTSKLVLISIRIIINTIKCNNVENNNIQQLLHDGNSYMPCSSDNGSPQNPFISVLIALSNHANINIKSAIHAMLNILFSQIPNENESEQYLTTIMESLIQSTKKQLNVTKQLNLVATLSSLSHNAIVSDILHNYKEDGIKVLSQLAMNSGPKTQEYIINICSNISSHEKGRLLITTTEHCLNALQYLMLHSTSTIVKSSATLTVTKLESMRKKGGFDSSTDNGLLILEQVFSNIKSNNDIMMNKGIESLGYMLSNTNVKQLTCTNSKIIQNIIAKTMALGNNNTNNRKTTKKQKNNTANNSSDTIGVYGLCNIYQNLSMSNFDKQKDKLKEMEVTAEQWKEFEKITKMAKSESNDIQDTKELVSNRVQAICIKHNGIEAMVHLSDILVENKHKIKGHLEIAQAFCNITSVQEPVEIASLIKSKIVQCGGLKSLLNLYDVCSADSNSNSIKMNKNKKKGTSKSNPINIIQSLIGQSISRILIHTNPSLLPHNTVLSCIQPLIINIRKSKDNLKEFEALMALTNLLSLQDDLILNKVCKHYIRDIEYCQFSSHELVRQAATECFCNMIYNDDFIEYIINNDGDKLRLWLAFAQANIDPSDEYIDDHEEGGDDAALDDITTLETSRAACGGLAMMCSIPVISKLIIKHDGLNIMNKILKESQNEDIRIRAVHCIKTLREVDGAIEIID